MFSKILHYIFSTTAFVLVEGRRKIIFKQGAHLTQRDRAAGWVSFGQKWKTGTGRQYRSIFNHCTVT